MAVPPGHPIEAKQVASRVAGSSRIVGHGVARNRRRAGMRGGLLHIKPRVGVEQPWDSAELRWGKGCGGGLPYGLLAARLAHGHLRGGTGAGCAAIKRKADVQHTIAGV